MLRSIKDVLRTKESRIVSVAPADTVYKALELMAANDIGAVLVMEQGEIKGIFSEREYSRKVILQGRSSLETSVQEIMSPELPEVAPETSIDEGLALMTRSRCRYLQVMDEGEFAGLVSIGDLVYSLISLQEFKIGQLENYILND